MSFSRTQHGNQCGARTPDLWIRSPSCKQPGHRAPMQKNETIVYQTSRFASLWNLQPGPTQTGLYGHRIWLHALYFGFRK